jgi:outer membrane lipoprotein-sorting protein
MVENGNTKLYRLGGALKKRRDVTGDPGKKQGALSFGVLSGEIWDDYAVSLQGKEECEGRPALVLALRANADPKGSYHVVWVDAENCRVLRRDRLDGDGALKHRHVFRNPFRSPAGTWLSRRVEVFNQFGKFVGAVEAKEIQVNQGLAESLFRT